jgi:hypothetical protein
LDGDDAVVIALIESPQVCSPKFPTCEQRSVYRLASAGGGAAQGFGGGVVVAEPVGLAVEGHQGNANRLGLTPGVGVALVCLLGPSGWVGRSGGMVGVVAGRVRCVAGFGRASRSRGRLR